MKYYLDLKKYYNFNTKYFFLVIIIIKYYCLNFYVNPIINYHSIYYS